MGNTFNDLNRELDEWEAQNGFNQNMNSGNRNASTYNGSGRNSSGPNRNPSNMSANARRNARKKNNRRRKAFKTENRLRVALYYAFQLLVDVVIVLIFIKGFSTAYNFSHDVFADSAKNLKSKEIVVVTILPDSSTSTVADALYDAGVIKNKYVMMAKIKVSESGSKIKSGKYGLSPSMTYSEIIKIITGGVSVNQDGYITKDEEKVSTPLDAAEIHDNSSVGAGDGPAEGDVAPEDGGETKGDETADSSDDAEGGSSDASTDDSSSDDSEE